MCGSNAWARQRLSTMTSPGEPGGEAAKAFMVDLVEGQVVVCDLIQERTQRAAGWAGATGERQERSFFGAIEFHTRYGQSGCLPDGVRLGAGELAKLFDRATPAEMREIISVAVRMCQLSPGQPIGNLDAETIRRALSSLKEMLAKAETVAD